MDGNFGLLDICSEGFELLGSDIRCVCELCSELLRDTNLVWVFLADCTLLVLHGWEFWPLVHLVWVFLFLGDCT